MIGCYTVRNLWSTDEAIDGLYQWIAWHLPRRLVYWCGIRMGAHASTGVLSNEEVYDILFVNILENW